MLKKITSILLIIIGATALVGIFQTYTESPELKTQLLDQSTPDAEETSDEEEKLVSEKCSFSDTRDPLVTLSCQSGVIGGYADGTFRPKNPANRAELLKINYSFFGDKAALSSISELLTKYNIWSFNDIPPDFWGSAYVALAKLDGRVQGYSDGNFAGYQNATRAEAWKMMTDAGLEANTRIRTAFEKIQARSTGDAWFSDYATFGNRIGMDVPSAAKMPLWEYMAEPISRQEILLFLNKMVNSTADEPASSKELARKSRSSVLILEEGTTEGLQEIIQELAVNKIYLQDSSANLKSFKNTLNDQSVEVSLLTQPEESQENTNEANVWTVKKKFE